MQCHKCGSEISGDEYRMVAQWPFCLQCFEQLLNKPAAPPPAARPSVEQPSLEQPPLEQPPLEQPPLEHPTAQTAVVSSPPEHAAPSTKAAHSACMLCEREIPDGTQLRLANWVFCSSCFAALVAQPEDEEEPSAEPRPKKSPFSPPTYVTRTSCKGCGRRIPERGGKEIDGELYCPDCYGKRSRSAVEVAPEIPAEVKVEARVALPHASTGKACESCGRAAAPESLQTVEGFGICQACLSTDADLALHLARQRHHLHMQRLKSELP